MAQKPAPTPKLPGKLETDPDLNRKPTPKLLSIDWKTTVVASEADALALWTRIAPTAEDWEPKLDEIPDEGPIATQLALALLRGGNLTCMRPAPKRDCPLRAAVDVDAPQPGATFDDPCLRRVLALWAISTLDDDDAVAAFDALKAIAAIPPPESQLVASVLDALPATEQDKRLELRTIAMAAGHRELVNGKLTDFDDAHLVAAAQTGKIDGALEALAAESHRAVFVAAITDEAIHPAARAAAITELVTQQEKGLAKDVKTALVKATKSPSCIVAAAASRALVSRGERTYSPARPRAKTAPPMMRALCVLASFEALQAADEPSYLLGYIPTRGLDVTRVTYDPYNDQDTDGDGDPHTERSTVTVLRDEVVLPEIDDMIRAFANCTGTTCKSDDHEFRFAFKPGPGGDLQLARLEVIERPPCPGTK